MMPSWCRQVNWGNCETPSGLSLPVLGELYLYLYPRQYSNVDWQGYMLVVAGRSVFLLLLFSTHNSEHIGRWLLPLADSQSSHRVAHCYTLFAQDDVRVAAPGSRACPSLSKTYGIIKSVVRSFFDWIPFLWHGSIQRHLGVASLIKGPSDVESRWHRPDIRVYATAP